MHLLCSLFHPQSQIRYVNFKPSEFLVRRAEYKKLLFPSSYKIYVADFGIVRAYKFAAKSETDSGASFMPLYAAHEVAKQEI
jgi:hypothetical protein